MCVDSNNDDEASSAVVQKRMYQNLQTPEKGVSRCRVNETNWSNAWTFRICAVREVVCLISIFDVFVNCNWVDIR